VYLDPGQHPEHLVQDIDGLLNQLQEQKGDSGLSSLGDPFLLEHQFEAAPAIEVAKQFGQNFVAKLRDIPTGHWFGPVDSGYGVHLVFVAERFAGRVPQLSEVRDAVLRDWTNARRLEANDMFYEGLLKHYKVTIERADPADLGQKFTKAK
jgi:hypothetical protein